MAGMAQTNPRFLPPPNATQVVVKGGAPVWNYVFDKDFHVSPFMAMDHVYDWCVASLGSVACLPPCGPHACPMKHDVPSPYLSLSS